MNDDQFNKIHELGIPVEVCPSSNKATMKLSVMSQLSSVKTLHKLGAVIIPCCDDTMLFNTNMMIQLFELVNLLQLNQLVRRYALYDQPFSLLYKVSMDQQ